MDARRAVAHSSKLDRMIGMLMHTIYFLIRNQLYALLLGLAVAARLATVRVPARKAVIMR
jgi:hypothetical protein